MNYFELFDFPIKYNIDKDDLLRKYLSAQRQQVSNINSAALNNAYNCLKDDIKRGEYFLSLHNKDTEFISAEIAVNMFELRQNFANLTNESEKNEFKLKLTQQLKDKIFKLRDVEDIDVFQEKFAEIQFINSFLEKLKSNVYCRN